MQLTTSEWNYVQSWIGTTEAQTVFEERATRLSAAQDGQRQSGIDAAIEESMRAQLAQLEFDQPSSVSLPGGITASYGENMRGIKDRLTDFISNYSTSKTTTIGRFSKMWREGSCR